MRNMNILNSSEYFQGVVLGRRAPRYEEDVIVNKSQNMVFCGYHRVNGTRGQSNNDS